MCGLFGVLSTTLSKAEISNAAFLGYLSATRGTDSTGVCVVGRSKKGEVEFEIEKRVQNTVSFLNNKLAMDALEKVDNPFLFMGHARAATIGAINEHNAHPIHEGSIIGCHNGTIGKLTPTDWKSDTDSDSRELIRLINRHPLEKVLNKAGEGAWAITYVDLQKKTINFVRNLQRPLCFMYTTSQQTLYWASELWMLKALKDKTWDKYMSDPFLLKSDLHHVIGFNKVIGHNIDLVIEEPKPKKASKNLFSKHSGQAWCKTCKKDSYYCHCEWENYKYDTSGTGTTKLLPAPKPTSVPNSRPGHVYKGWENSLRPVKDVVPFLLRGCANCKQRSNPVKKNFWFSEENFLCAECYENGDGVVKEHITSKHSCYESKLVRTN